MFEDALQIAMKRREVKSKGEKERYTILNDFSGGSDGKASVYNVGDLGSIPGLGRSPGEEMAVHSRTIAWKIPWTEEPGRLQAMDRGAW